MKKLLALLAMSATLSVMAQTENDSTSSKREKGHADWYIGVGGITQSKYNLNDKLASASLPELNLTVFEFAVGMNVFEDKYSGDIEFGFFGNQNDEGNERSRLVGINSRLRAHYNIVNTEKVAFTGGLNFTYTTNQVDIFSRNATIDMNNLGASKNDLSIRNAMFYVGPSVALYLFKNKKYETRVNLGYELALTRGRYKSDFSSINNAIGESGNNRFVFGITLL